MNHRPYREINEPPPPEPSSPGLVHLIIGAALFVLVFFGLLFMWALLEHKPAQINDRTWTLEQAEKAAMSPQKP